MAIVEYRMMLTDAATQAGRDQDAVNRLSRFTRSGDFDILPYVSDSNWSDTWIDQLIDCDENINHCASLGMSLMDVFTYKHNPAVFYQVCKSIDNGNIKKIPIYWLKDTNWTAVACQYIIDLFKFSPTFDWTSNIYPYTTLLALREIGDTSGRELGHNGVREIVGFWKNVTPKLEFALRNDDPNLSTEKRRDQYEEYRKIYRCDGDELADYIYDGKYKKYVLNRNKYWHSVNSGPNAFASAVSAMNG